MITLKFLKKLKPIGASFTTGLVFIAFGLVLLGLTVLISFSQQAAANSNDRALQSNSQVNHVPLIKGTPVRIQIDSVGIDLKVIPGHYYPATKSWTLSLNDAQWGTMTAPANNVGGETFIYAHYRKGVFLTLPKVQSGAVAKVTTDNGHVFTYTYKANKVTSPGDTSLFDYKGKPILVLQTCSGLWFQNRQLFVFDFQEVN